MNKIQEYFKSKRVSNSLLGAMNNPKIVWLHQQGLIEDEEKIFFRIGSAIDCLLTNQEDWEQEFVVIDSNRPTGLMLAFVDTLPPGINMFSGSDMYEEAYKASGYKANIKTVIKWFWDNPDNFKYYENRFVDIGNRVLLTKDEYDIVQQCVSTLLENEYTSGYFMGTETHIERILQLPIYFELEGLECKSLLDGLILDHKNKTIQPFDLKSTGKTVYGFPTSFWQFGYFRQAAFYTLALKEYIRARNLYSKEDLDSYTILPFKFIVVETKLGSKNPALIYTTTEKDIHAGLYGGCIKETQSSVKGVYELLEDYRWHTENNKWLIPREAYLNQGELLLDIFI